MNIILIGMMGAGKTTAGRILAQSLRRTLADTDDCIERREGRTISEIFAQDGEAHFRALELALCRELSGQTQLVVSCGGGLPLREDCMEPLKRSGPVFWLDRDPGATYDSLDVSSRPLAQAGRDAFLERAAQRAPVYRRWADYIIKNPASPERAAERIMEILESEETPS